MLTHRSMIILGSIAIIIAVTPVFSLGESGGQFNHCMVQSYYDTTHTRLENQCGEALFITTCNNDLPSNCRSLLVGLGESSNFYSGRNGGSFAACKRGQKPVRPGVVIRTDRCSSSV